MKHNDSIIIKGNDASVYGAILAGCDAFFGYPITPASEIAHTAALLFPQLDRVFLQAESEIAAINMVLGASAAGRRSMTASSGLGISLKQEGVSYIAASNLPAVIVDITRGGPGLGNIAPEQADYNQVVKGGGHGNYKCVVLAPNSVQEMCDLTMLAFVLSEKYLIPVYVLADGVIGQMMEAVTLPDAVDRRVIPEWAIAATHESRHNFITSIFLEPEELEKVNIKLQEKYAQISLVEQRCEEYLTDDAELIIAGYGIVSRISRNVVDNLRQKGIKAGLVRPVTLFPFPVKAFRKVEKTAKNILCVEMSNGQMVDDVKLSLEESHRKVRFYGRIVPSVNEIEEECLKIIGKTQ